MSNFQLRTSVGGNSLDPRATCIGKTFRCPTWSLSVGTMKVFHDIRKTPAAARIGINCTADTRNAYCKNVRKHEQSEANQWNRIEAKRSKAKHTGAQCETQHLLEHFKHSRPIDAGARRSESLHGVRLQIVANNSQQAFLRRDQTETSARISRRGNSHRQSRNVLLQQAENDHHSATHRRSEHSRRSKHLLT